MSLKRRDFLKLTGVGGLGALLSWGRGQAATGLSGKYLNLIPATAAPIPKPNGPRVVIVGAGWSGLTIAKYLKKYNAGIDVVLIDKRSGFMSSPVSNLWVSGLLNLDFLMHSFHRPAVNNKYYYLNAWVVDVDRAKRIVHTTEGTVNYDYLVLAPGIDYDYSRLVGDDTETEARLRQEYPGGFIPMGEHLYLKEKVEAFEKGVFLLTCPGGNYRCLPAPYERTCMIADYFKREGIPGKVVLLDENPDITIKKDGFHSAFDELYKDYVEYYPSSPIVKIDLDKKVVETELGDQIQFADAAIYPRVRGAKLVEKVGLAKDGINKGEANIDVFTYQAVDDERVFIAGDARPMAFSKSGNTANSEGKFVAKVIANRIAGKETPWESPTTICYSAVAGEPLRAIKVQAGYAYNKEKGQFQFANASTMELWDTDKGTQAGQALLEWAKGLYRDMLT